MSNMSELWVLNIIMIMILIPILIIINMMHYCNKLNLILIWFFFSEANMASLRHQLQQAQSVDSTNFGLYLFAIQVPIP